MTYTPPKVWKMDQENGEKSAFSNKPTAGARFERELPVGSHPFQLYSMATPNGVKVTTMFEELLEAGISEAQYDAHLINIHEQDQFSSGFVALNPNSKIPALIHKSGINDHKEEIRIFESGSILFYLAEKFNKFLPKDPAMRAKTMSWLFWQVGSAPYVGGGFGHFYASTPEKLKYPIDRFSMEAKRQLDVLDHQLAQHEYIVGAEYTIADMAIFPWYGTLAKGDLFNAAEFLNVQEYKNIRRWADQLLQRPAILRGRLVNKVWGDEDQQIPVRHSKADFDNIDISYRSAK